MFFYSCRFLLTNKQGENEITENLLKSLNKDGRIHVVPAKIKDQYIIRFTVTSFSTTEQDIRRDWQVIKCNADKVLRSRRPPAESGERTRQKKLTMQSSLLLANAPQTPKIVNASFLAFCADFDLDVSDLARQLLNSRDYMQSHLPLTPRRKPKYLTDKNYSLDHFSSVEKTVTRDVCMLSVCVWRAFSNASFFFGVQAVGMLALSLWNLTLCIK